ncbi:MAG TPA: BLUF domain-containing protein [Burkholderiaceae bacterium]|nr:BLUF domain-containing protein [Burkholderiaceae bacterium]
MAQPAPSFQIVSVHVGKPALRQPRGGSADHRDHQFGSHYRQGAQCGARHCRCVVSGAGHVPAVARWRSQCRQRLYARILADKRHCDAEILFLDEVASRRFRKWSMAHIVLSDLDAMVQMNHPEFGPY